MAPHHIKAKGFLLRPLGEEDAHMLAKNGKRAAFHRDTGSLPMPRDAVSAQKWIARNKKMPREEGDPDIIWGIDVGGEIAGLIGLIHRTQKEAEIGFWLAQKYCGKGVIRDAVHLVSKHGLGRYGLKRIYARTTSINDASARALLEDGYTAEQLPKGDGSVFVKTRT